MQQVLGKGSTIHLEKMAHYQRSWLSRDTRDRPSYTSSWKPQGVPFLSSAIGWAAACGLARPMRFGAAPTPTIARQGFIWSSCRSRSPEPSREPLQ